MGVDIRVDEAIVFGLPETIENLLQEGGRPMRGTDEETNAWLCILLSQRAFRWVGLDPIYILIIAPT